jgi:serine/threonine protein kinase
LPAERQTDGWTKGRDVPAGAAIAAARVERTTGLANAERDSRPAAAHDHRSYRDLRKLLEQVPDLDTPLARTANSTEAEYTISKQIGHGAYAVVRSALQKSTNRKVAAKIYEKQKLAEPQRRKSVWREIRIMERLSHPHIVQFVDAIDTTKYLYIVMEYLGGGSLHHYLKRRTSRRLDEVRARRIFYQSCQGLKYLHDRCVVHRDIKLENLLLDENGIVKIIDFGFATIVPRGKKIRVFCGTPSYMAPEIVTKKEHAGPNTDVWAIGVVLYATLCGTFPFKAQNDRELYTRIAKGVFTFPDNQVGKEVQALVYRMLTTDWQRRPLIADVLQDDWVKKYGSHNEAKEEEKPAPTKHSTSISSQTTAASAREASNGASKEKLESRPELVKVELKSDSKAESQVEQTTCEPKLEQTATLPSIEKEDTRPMPAADSDNTLPKAVDSRRRSEEVDGWSGGVLRSIGAPPPSAAPKASAPEAPPITVDEEAIKKLQRLGYQREDIIEQLKNENSHLYKLYFRFLRALNAWDTADH